MQRCDVPLYSVLAASAHHRIRLLVPAFQVASRLHPHVKHAGLFSLEYESCCVFLCRHSLPIGSRATRVPREYCREQHD